jgi:hypothetical protein
MVTIDRVHGLRVVIFLDDHEPAHVHVFGDGHAKINLGGVGGIPELVWAEGMTKAEIRRAMRTVQEKQHEYLARWNKIHG